MLTGVNKGGGVANIITAKDLDERLTVTVEQVGLLLGLSRGSAFAAVRRGDIFAVRIGSRWIVPVDRLKEKLNPTQESVGVGSGGR